MGDWELQRKALLPYLQRAAEIEAVDPKVAYYCRLYAVEQGIKLENRDDRAEDLLELVLNQLEKDKPHLVLDSSVDLEHCEKFALNVYVKAKRRDEQGISDRDTAKAYYAAFNFIEILKQFGQLSPEVEKERRFAVFRAAEIKRCLDEGKEPPPLQHAAFVNGGGSDTESQQRKDAAPLSIVDYDPGYSVGSKVLFMDGESGLMRKGYIHGKATEVGGFFNVQAEDGTERQLGAVFLAPDLSGGGDVTYFFPDGRQSPGHVMEMDSHKWPPNYTVKLEDQTTLTVTHSQFVLSFGSLTSDDMEVVKAELGATQSLPTTPEHEEQTPGLPTSASVNSPTGHPIASETRHGPILKRDSWLKHHKPGAPRQGSFASQSSSATVPVGTLSENRPLVPAELPPQYPSPVSKPLTPEDYYQEEDVGIDYVAAVSPPAEVIQADAVQERTAEAAATPIVLKRSDYQPDAAAMQQATRLAQNATAALNFSDADRAIEYLQEALKCLTQPRE